MKKIFTSLCLASLCLAASAQDLTVTVDGQVVANGATVTSSHLDVVEYDGVVYQWELYPELLVKSEKGTNIAMTVTNLGGSVKYTDKAETEVPGIAFCGIDLPGGAPGSCQTIAEGNSITLNQTLPAGVEGTGRVYFMSTNFSNPAPEKLDANARVKIVSDSETFEFTLNMAYSGSAVKQVALGGNDFTVVGGSVVAPGEVEVYDLAGRRVENAGLNGMYIVRTAGKAAKVVVK